MTTKILESDNRDLSEHRDSEHGHVAREPYGSYAFAWAMIGALGTLLSATIIVVLFF
jgi:hypothetical protein